MGFLGALLGAAPYVTAGIAKGQRANEQTQYDRAQADQDAALKEQARQQALQQAMMQFQSGEADRKASRDLQSQQHGELMKHYQTQDAQTKAWHDAEVARQTGRDKIDETHWKQQLGLGYASLGARKDAAAAKADQPVKYTMPQQRWQSQLPSLKLNRDAIMADPTPISIGQLRIDRKILSDPHGSPEMLRDAILTSGLPDAQKNKFVNLYEFSRAHLQASGRTPSAESVYAHMGALALDPGSQVEAAWQGAKAGAGIDDNKIEEFLGRFRPGGGAGGQAVAPHPDNPFRNP